MAQLDTYLIGDKKIAARSLTQAMYTARAMVNVKPKPLTAEQEQKARRTQYHNA
jgi:hypothetical protein